LLPEDAKVYEVSAVPAHPDPEHDADVGAEGDSLTQYPVTAVSSVAV